MKVLWFTVTSSLYEDKISGHNGGGWISSLEKIVRDTDIELAVAFEHTDKIFKKNIDNVIYYPINAWETFISTNEKKFSVEADEKYLIPKCMEIIEDFKPDIIQVFGSEWCFGLITKYTNIPVIVHMQGSLPSYYNARYPAGISTSSLLLSSKISFFKKIMILKNNFIFKNRAIREEKILKNCKNFMGRTHWDKSIVNFYNTSANYYICNEALRDSFINSENKWVFKEENKIIFVSTISGPWYKGMDLVLKTAKLLSDNTEINFEWKIFGIKDCSFYEQFFKIKCDDVKIKLMGVVDENILLKELLNSQFYIHPSYIDNSPNSVCEAQILGVPIISTNVGGISSLVENYKTGFLVPSNDPLKMADIIKNFISDSEMLKQISTNSINVAEERHSPEKIKAELLNIYKELVNKK